MLNIDLGKKISSLRVENKITQGFVAGELNMSQSAYSRMERRET
ncbi:MAG: helix-turn-helix transcriptional regulator [Bacteroidetes bacterium]|nr:helix-turn-helix transcriptional regulator [Bacteroidota bacterium]MDA1115948.1 helix-turn-helix transcriptional regulator [Bacteroidota bacterium]